MYKFPSAILTSCTSHPFYFLPFYKADNDNEENDAFDCVDSGDWINSTPLHAFTHGVPLLFRHNHAIYSMNNEM